MHILKLDLLDGRGEVEVAVSEYMDAARLRDYMGATRRLFDVRDELAGALKRIVRWYDNEHLQAETLFGDPTEAFAQARAALTKLEAK